MKKKSGFLILSLFLAGCTNQADDRPVADLLFTDGRIYTADASGTIAEAVAIQGNRILFVGSSADAREFHDEKTRVVNLDGKMMLPGLHDVHIHALGIVERDQCDFRSEPMSLEEIVGFVAECLERYGIADGEWLIVNQWNFSAGNQPGKNYPTLRAALDAVSLSSPIFLRGNDGHHGAANSAALAKARNSAGEQIGLSRATLDSDFSAYRELVGVDAEGEPNGALNEGARELVEMPSLWGDDTADDQVMRDIAAKLASYGITSIQDAALDPALLPLFDAFEKTGQMSFRFRAALFPDFNDFEDDDGRVDIDEIIANLTETRARYEHSSLISADAAKIFVDGVIEGNPLSVPPTLPNGAALDVYKQPRFSYDAESDSLTLIGYVDTGSELCVNVRSRMEEFSDIASITAFRLREGFHPAQCIESRGVLEHDVEVIESYVAALEKNGFTVHAHAIGDRAVRTAVDAFEKSRRVNGETGLPHAIAHAQLIHPDDQRRIGELGLYVAFTYAWISPLFPYDMSVTPFIVELEDETHLYDKENYYYGNVYPVRGVKDAGAVLVAGSDAPVDTREPRPFFNIQQAVTRANESGVVMNAEQRIDIREAIAAYTRNGARQLRQDDKLGSIEAGKIADLIVIDHDLLALHAEGRGNEIGDTKVLMTVFDGKIVYTHEGADL